MAKRNKKRVKTRVKTAKQTTLQNTVHPRSVLVYASVVVIVLLALGTIISCMNEDLTSTEVDENGALKQSKIDQILSGEPVDPDIPYSSASATKNLDDEIKVTERGIKFIVDPKKILSGGPPKDGIPSIDNPKFVTVEQADKWIEDNELALAIVYKGVKRVYPLQILVWHEIVNDWIAEDPILITYCPLCGSGIAYHRVIHDDPVEFGTSGKLYNSNLVMYDRLTDTYWSQIDGKAIVGPMVGYELRELNIDTVAWRDWKKFHPESEVLSQQTGYSRAYGRDPYGNYYENTFVMFPVENEDDRIHPKTVIFGVEVNGTYKAYREDDLISAGGMLADKINNVSLSIERSDAGLVMIFNDDTGEEIVKERDFWFAWYAFHPDTLLYSKE